MSRYRKSLLDLFCGCGGVSLGFRLAGCELVGAVDVDAQACDTYERNLGLKPLQGDLRNINGRQILKEFDLEKGDVDIVVGCPPCQSFSSLRRTTKGKEPDPRDDLIMTFACMHLNLRRRR